MEQIEIDGLTIAYRRAGSGPPLVLLHGGPLDSREWRYQLDGLSDTFYAGWAGSLPPAEVEKRRQQVLRLIEAPPDQFAREWIPTLFTSSAAPA